MIRTSKGNPGANSLREHRGDARLRGRQHDRLEREADQQEPFEAPVAFITANSRTRSIADR